LTRFLVEDSTVTANINGLTDVKLVVCHELDAAVEVPVVIPIRK
jgi:hypothetical protein